jgi:predicted RNA binding protein YcfA (HicA-like mRNA interferase family)
MKTVSGKKFCKVLEIKGWELKRIRGSHHIYCNPVTGEKVSVPVHNNDDLKIGLLNALLKQAGISEYEL